jgi:glutaredoxin
VSEARNVVVYTQPHCASCSQVERFLEQRGVAFTVRDVSKDPRALEEIASRGYMSTPVTRIGDRWVAGFRRKELESLL